MVKVFESVSLDSMLQTIEKERDKRKKRKRDKEKEEGGNASTCCGVSVSLPNSCVCVCVCVSAQSCLTLCNPMDCGPPDSCPWESPSQRYRSGLPFPPPGYLPDPGIKPTSP